MLCSCVPGRRESFSRLFKTPKGSAGTQGGTFLHERAVSAYGDVCCVHYNGMTVNAIYRCEVALSSEYTAGIVST